MSDVQVATPASTEAAKKRGKIATTETAEDFGSVTWNFANGEVRTVVLLELPENVRAFLQAHGAKQKLTDVYAGQGITPDQAVGMWDKLHDALRNGQVVLREAGEGAPDSIDDLVAAFLMFRTEMGQPVTENTAPKFRSYYEALDKDGKRATRQKLMVQLAKVKAARLKPQVGEVDLLAADFAA